MNYLPLEYIAENVCMQKLRGGGWGKSNYKGLTIIADGENEPSLSRMYPKPQAESDLTIVGTMKEDKAREQMT
jgi:hypothetical protein